MIQPLHDFQVYLENWRREQREDMKAIEGKLDAFIDKSQVQVYKLDRRISLVEQTQGTMKWLARTAIVGFVTFLFDILVNHAPKWFHN